MKIDNYDVDALRICFVYDRVNAVRHQPKRFDMHTAFDHLISDDNRDVPDRGGWAWNVATIIGSEFYETQYGKPYDQLALSRLNYRVCYFNASAEDMRKTNIVRDIHKRPTMAEKIRWNWTNHSGHDLFEMYRHNTKGVIAAEKYLQRHASLLGSSLVTETKNAVTQSVTRPYKQTLVVPALAAHECRL